MNKIVNYSVLIHRFGQPFFGFFVVVPSIVCYDRFVELVRIAAFLPCYASFSF